MEGEERSGSAAGLPGSGRVRLAVGIGNPGKEHEATRHNAGTWLVERLAKERGWGFSKVGDLPADLAGTAGGVRLARTKTYMNDSGTAVAALARYLGVGPASLLVAHDESDLAPGQARFKFGGGLAGHNGLKDIAAKLKTNSFWRLRIGIGHPGDSEDEDARRVPLDRHVLARPLGGEVGLIDGAIGQAASAWADVEVGDMDKAIRALHTRRGG